MVWQQTRELSGTCMQFFFIVTYFLFFQKPLTLQGHDRSLTQIKYNREGDFLFTAGKNQTPNVWFSLNGERLGTYNGHQGAVWCLDCDWTTTKLITGAGDAKAM